MDQGHIGIAWTIPLLGRKSGLSVGYEHAMQEILGTGNVQTRQVYTYKEKQLVKQSKMLLQVNSLCLLSH